MTAQTKSEKDRVVIFDTTLRDGEQCPGATMEPLYQDMASRVGKQLIDDVVKATQGVTN